MRLMFQESEQEQDWIKPLLKASFGGDRSAAGRYAAEQRWKGHAKSDKPTATNLNETLLIEGKRFYADEDRTRKITKVRISLQGEEFEAEIISDKTGQGDKHHREVTVYVLNKKRELIGEMVARRGWGAESEEQMTISNIVVEDDYQRRGIATAMLHLGRKYNLDGEHIYHSENLTVEGGRFAAAIKASFGGDRSAAGRYAAEQRWKGHQKKGDKPAGGRTTDQKLAEGPTNLLFGRDANGMPVMGSVKELKTRYGKSAEAREQYFRTRYGVKLKIKPAKAGSVAEAVQMGVLQALEELCLSTNLDSQILQGVSVGDTGGDPNYEKEANGWYSNGYVTVKPETIEKRLGDLLSKLYGIQTSRGVGLKPSTKEDEDWYGDEAMSNIPLYSTSQMLPSIPAVAQDLKPYFSTDPTKQPPSRKDLYSQMAQRAGYAVMVHEFGHAVDFGGSTQGESVSTQAGEEWDKLRAPTQYGRYNPYEKAAESFAAWWLFGGGQGNLPKGIAGIGRLADPILRPILEARGDLVKNATPPIDIATLPLDHPVIQFILAPLLNPALRKARVKVDAMIAAAFAKASFGGDRSAAGRYAAEQRWKNNKKAEPKTEPRKLSQTDMLDVHEDMMGRQEEVIKKADIPNEAHRAYQLYPTSAHAAMNQVLRGQKVEGMWVSETIRPEVAAKALKDNFDKMAIETPETLVVYRGIPNGEDAVGIIEGGTEFEDAGLISTSLSAKFAREFGDGNGVDIVFKITVPKGTKVLVPKGPYWEREREVVLRPDTKFKVKEVIYDSDEYGERAEVICEVVNE